MLPLALNDKVERGVGGGERERERERRGGAPCKI